MKTSKRIISFVLCAVMVASCFFCTGKLPELEAHADVTLGGITQTRVVSNYESLYRSYQKRFFGGEETNWPTDFVIPGLSSADDYTPQGMTYWAEKEWILISAYDAGGNDASVIYALDVVSTNLVAVFKIQNADGTTNTSHGGGIAASKYNFYYADSASKISYVPLSEMDISGGEKTIRLRDSIDLSKEMTAETTVKTSFCCYDEGVLWTGNFYLKDHTDYGNGFLPSIGYPSILMGYKLAGNSSAEEWYYLKHGYNLVSLNVTTDSNTGALVEQDNEKGTTYSTYSTDGANAEIRGKVTTDTALGEATANFATVNLTEGVTYKIEFIADNNLSDMYMFAPNNGGHCNVKQSQASTITNLGDGRYHYQMIFTAGLKPASADSSWPTTQSTSGAYTGTYTIRFDQDSVPAGGRSFAITDFSISEYVEPQGFTPNSLYEGIGCQGNPTYVVGLNTDRVQYAMVDKGKIYISRSWSRSESTNHVRELVIGDIDLGMPGSSTADIGGRSRPVHLFDYGSATKFNGNNMLWMGEALCVINDYLHMFGESAAWTYNGKEDNKCSEPIDVIWKIDQYAIQGLTRPHEDVAAVEYEKVNSLSELKSTDEYIVLHTSPIKDPVTQDNILYLLDSYGGYGDKKLPKKDASANVDSAFTGDSIGVVGYEIRDYSVKIDELTGKESLIISAEDDANKSLHWQFESGSSTSLKLKSRDLYYAKQPYFYSGDTLFAMTTAADGNMRIQELGNGNFKISGGGGTYPIWCNDGSVQASIDSYSYLYANHGYSTYPQNYHSLKEIAGTFHTQNSTNIAQGTDEQMYFQIYKRVSDPYASTYQTQIYSDMQAKLTSDGTYNITLETYATNDLQYQQVDKRPTDFIFVLDTSGSMSTQDCNGYHRHNAFQLMAVAGTDAGTAGGITNNSTNSSTVKTYDPQIMWIQHTDGVMCPIGVKIQGDGRKWEGLSYTYYQRVYLWYTHPQTGVKYWFHVNSNNLYGTWTTEETTYDESIRIGSNDKEVRGQREVFNGVCYEKRSDSSRLSNMQLAVNQLVWKIQEKATADNLDHRIAVVQYGSNSSGSWTNTGMYTNDSTAMKQCTGYDTISATDLGKAFHSVSQFGNVKNIVNNLTASGDTFVDYGIDMANNIIMQNGANYKASGNRSACIIMITDGCPGFGGDDSSTATTVANAAIGTAYNLKRNGAYVYTVQMGNNSMSGFDMDEYMRYLSSNYTGSQNLTSPGQRNPKEIDYYMQVDAGSSFDLTSFVNDVFNSVVTNSTNAIASLTSDAILREHLTDAFDTSNASIKYETAQSKYDGIGRLYFEDPVAATGISGTLTDANEISITGFDYSANNVSEYNSDLGNGKKLIVTISGVIANRNEELFNTSINDDKLTALYENSTYMSSNQPVKKFPTYHFSIPEYTYVMDYDLPMLDTDINGTLVSVDTEPDKQSTYCTNLQTDVLGVEFTNNNQDMYYSLNSQEGSTEKNSRAYVLIKRDDGTYDWFRLNLLPASVVYYEEDKTATVSSTASYGDWTQVGSTAGKYQSLSGKDDVFGNDPILSKYSTDNFSLNTHLETTVSSSNKRSETKTFSFKGTGFDLVSVCGPDTGIQTVVVRDANGELVQTYIVDTYYNDAKYGTIYQAPIVHFEGAYGEYTVETTAAYYSFAGALKTQSVDVNALGDTGIDAYSATAETSATDEFFAEIGMDELIGQEVELVWMDEDSVLNGGMGATETTVSTQAGESSSTTTPATSLINYIDGFRIYNPLEEADSNAYYPATEKDANFFNLVKHIGTGALQGDSNFFGYIEGSSNNFAFTDYINNGPKNEIYLDSNGALTFKIRVNMKDLDNVRPFISMRTVSGNPTVIINGLEYSNIPKNETYYDVLSPLFEPDGIVEAPAEGSTTGTYQYAITIKPSSSNDLVAIGNLRLTNAELENLNAKDLSNAVKLMTMASSPVDYDTSKLYSPAPTFSPAPADDPNIDPEGRIPTFEEYIAIHGSGNNGDDHSGADSFADKLIAIVEKVIDFIKKVIALVANTVTSIF